MWEPAEHCDATVEFVKLSTSAKCQDFKPFEIIFESDQPARYFCASTFWVTYATHRIHIDVLSSQPCLLRKKSKEKKRVDRLSVFRSEGMSARLSTLLDVTL